MDCWGRHTHGWSDLLCSSSLSLNNKNSPLSSVWSNEMTTLFWRDFIVLKLTWNWSYLFYWPRGFASSFSQIDPAWNPREILWSYLTVKKPTKWIYFRWPITSFTEVATLCSFCGRHIWNSFGKTLNFGRFQRCEVYTHWPVWSGFWSSLDGDVLHLSVL